MSDTRIVYVCVGNRGPRKTEIPVSMKLEDGTRFEFQGRIVEITDVHVHPKGTQLQVEEV